MRQMASCVENWRLKISPKLTAKSDDKKSLNASNLLKIIKKEGLLTCWKESFRKFSKRRYISYIAENKL